MGGGGTGKSRDGTGRGIKDETKKEGGMGQKKSDSTKGRGAEWKDDKGQWQDREE